MTSGKDRTGRPNGVRLAPLGAALLLLAACGGKALPPQPGEGRGVPPDLTGRRVLVLPVQSVVGVAGDADAELAFALKERGRDVTWIFEEEVNEILVRSPALRTRTRGLPVGNFLIAEVDRVGDPLFGDLRRLAALVEGEAILLPVQVSFQANENVVGATPRVRLTMALLEARTGRVAWFGVEEGGDFPQQDPRGLASAVEKVARTLLWYMRD